jgi:predicted ester cyclase
LHLVAFNKAQIYDPFTASVNMPSWTHLIRFVVVEDGLVHLGQLVHPTRDVGLDAFDETPIWAFEIEGDIYDGHPTENKLQVREVCPSYLL